MDGVIGGSSSQWFNNSTEISHGRTDGRMGMAYWRVGGMEFIALEVFVCLALYG